MSGRLTALYLRISQDRQGTEAGVDRQRDACTAAAEQRGANLDVEYLDNDISATSGRTRPSFERLLADIEARTVGTIVAISMERLLRTNRDKYRLLEACQAHEVNIVVAKGTDIDMRTAVGRMVADNLATAARFEVELKSERQQLEREQAAERGWSPPSKRAFGYQERVKFADGGYTSPLHEKEAPLVAAAYRQLLSGRSVGSIVRWLNEQNARTVAGNPWTHNSLLHLLVNPKYKGVRAVRKKKPGREGMANKREKYHTEIGPAQWQPIVSAEVFDAAQTILRDPARMVGHPVNEHYARYLLPSLAECGVCGVKLVSGTRVEKPRSSGERTRARLVRCPEHHVSRKAAPIERVVEAYLLGALSTPQARLVLRRQLAANTGNVEWLREQIAVKRTQVQEATDDWLANLLSRAERQRIHQRLQVELDELDQQMATAVSSSPVLELASSDDPTAVWEQWPMEAKRAVVAARLKVVVHRGASGRPGGKRFDPASVSITWRDETTDS